MIGCQWDFLGAKANSSGILGAAAGIAFSIYAGPSEIPFESGFKGE